MTAGHFITPDAELAGMADPNLKLGIPVYSGHKAINHAAPLKGQNKIFDEICAKLEVFDLPYEDQCSVRYYFDLVSTLRDFSGEFDRLVEVGVFMGGSSAIFGGCIERFDFDLDLVDISADFLQYSYERIRRLFPQSIGRVRMFHGDLPSYVNTVMLAEKPERCVIHHDGAHDFNQVVKDMASLSFVREQVHAIIAQDTHLRGTSDCMNFVDMALYAVFGTDLNYAPIGTCYGEWDLTMTTPNVYQGNYFVPDAPEGFVLPMAMNEFRYPHPNLKLDSFLPVAAAA